MNALSTAWKWRTPIFAATMLVAISISYLLLIPALGKLSNQARAGQQAKTRQCDTFPVSVKLYRAAAHFHLITAADLKTFLSNAPVCPK